MVVVLLYTAKASLIVYRVGVVSKFSAAPTQTHLSAVQKNFLGLECTIDLTLEIQN